MYISFVPKKKIIIYFVSVSYPVRSRPFITLKSSFNIHFFLFVSIYSCNNWNNHNSIYSKTKEKEKYKTRPNIVISTPVSKWSYWSYIVVWNSLPCCKIWKVSLASIIMKYIKKNLYIGFPPPSYLSIVTPFFKIILNYFLLYIYIFLQEKNHIS